MVSQCFSSKQNWKSLLKTECYLPSSRNYSDRTSQVSGRIFLAAWRDWFEAKRRPMVIRCWGWGNQAMVEQECICKGPPSSERSKPVSNLMYLGLRGLYHIDGNNSHFLALFSAAFCLEFLHGRQ